MRLPSRGMLVAERVTWPWLRRAFEDTGHHAIGNMMGPSVEKKYIFNFQKRSFIGWASWRKELSNQDQEGFLFSWFPKRVVGRFPTGSTLTCLPAKAQTINLSARPQLGMLSWHQLSLTCRVSEGDCNLTVMIVKAWCLKEDSRKDWNLSQSKWVRLSWGRRITASDWY